MLIDLEQQAIGRLDLNVAAKRLIDNGVIGGKPRSGEACEYLLQGFSADKREFDAARGLAGGVFRAMEHQDGAAQAQFDPLTCAITGGKVKAQGLTKRQDSGNLADVDHWHECQGGDGTLG